MQSIKVDAIDFNVMEEIIKMEIQFYNEKQVSCIIRI